MFDSSDLLSQAIEAVQTGQRGQARELCLQIVEQDPQNVQAWIYLSWLIDDVEDQLIAIENALELLPDDEELVARREAHLQAYPHLSPSGQKPILSEELALARQLAADQKVPEAVALLRTVAEHYSSSELVWLELARLEPILKDRLNAAEKALKLNPDSQDARQMLEQVQQEQKNPFQRGQHLEEQGEFEQATKAYLSIATHSRLATERLEAQRRMESIQLRQEAHHIQPVHPNLTLGRLAAGPVLLFMIAVFMQSGLKPTHMPLLALPGALGVIAGSLLVALTEMVPAHPKWVEWFGQPGTSDEPDMRRGLRLLGWSLMLATYTIFFIEAGSRLGALQSTLLSGMH